MNKRHLNISLFLIIIVIGMYLLHRINPTSFYQYFVLKSTSIGDIFPWQFFTYVFFFPENILFFFFTVLILLWFGSSLENLWGSVNFGIFLLITIVSKSFASFIFGADFPIIGHYSFYLCLMVAFGFNFYHSQIHLFFIIPVRVKILAIIGLILAVFHIIFTFTTGYYNIFYPGIITLPPAFAILLTNIFSYISLFIYWDKIFGKVYLANKFKSSLKNAKYQTKNHIDVSKNKKINTLYKNYLETKKIDDELSKFKKTNNITLCESYDFHENDKDCLECDKYGYCIYRKINIKHE